MRDPMRISAATGLVLLLAAPVTAQDSFELA